MITNKIVFITGASSGIGEACAKRLAAMGAKLILTARRMERLETLAQTLKNEFGSDCFIAALDVRKPDEVEKLIKSLPTSWQDIDILINNAGLALSSDPIQQGSIENWDTMIDTNIKGLLYVTRNILPGMLARNQGHIVNIGSIAGQETYPNGNVYCATKHAVRAINQSLRIDLNGSALRVTEIAPGAVETEFSTVRWKDAEKAHDFYQQIVPLQAQDIADAVAYCVNCPPHVNIATLTIMPTVQASANLMHRKK